MDLSHAAFVLLKPFFAFLSDTQEMCTIDCCGSEHKEYEEWSPSWWQRIKGDNILEGLCMPEVVPIPWLEMRLESQNVRLVDVMDGIRPMLSIEEWSWYQQPTAESKWAHALFPKVREYVNQMASVWGSSSKQVQRIVFVCPNYRALKFAGLKRIFYFFPSTLFMQKMVMPPADGEEYAEHRLRVAQDPFSEAHLKFLPDWFSAARFDLERDDLLLRKRSKMITFHGHEDLLQKLAREFVMNIKV